MSEPFPDTPAAPARPRYRCTLAYDGSAFHGWQKQEPPDRPALRTVQGVVEDALVKVLRQPRETLRFFGASRTDTGVHALGQVAQFDAEITIPLQRLAQAINSRLPDDVEVREVQLAPPGFDCITQAVNKQYRYRVFNATHRPLWLRHTVYPCFRGTLDLGLMMEGARRLVGTHDLEGLSAAGHGRDSTVRTIYRCDAIADPAYPHEVHITVQGSGFLYNTVRILAGTLVEIGLGRMPAERVDEILATANRRLAGPTLPPQGLCLEWIEHRDPSGSRFRE